MTVKYRGSRVRAGAVAAFGVILAIAGCSSGKTSQQPPASNAATSNATGGATSAATSTGDPFKGPDSALKPYDPNAPAGEAPPSSLPKVAAWESQSNAPFWLQYANAIKRGLQGSGVQLLTGNANSDSNKDISDIRAFLQRGIGALVTVPVGGNEPLVPVQQEAISKGAIVIGELAGPAHQVITVDQYNAGHVQGADAVKWIKANMGGQARVFVFDNDNVSPQLIPRRQGLLDALKAGGSGIKVVERVSNLPDVAKGQEIMRTALQAHPEINVVLGDDESVLGAVQAYRSAGKLSQLKYASGIDGSPDALDAIKAGNTPFKADYGFNYGVMGLVTGESIRDWFAGKSVPRVASFKPFAMTSGTTIAQYEHAAEDPIDADIPNYIELLGNVSYSARGSYVDYTPLQTH